MPNHPSDYVDDTPRSQGNPRPDKCPSSKQDSCPNLPGKDDWSNFMMSTPDRCRDHFTPGQVERAVAVAEMYGVY